MKKTFTLLLTLCIIVVSAGCASPAPAETPAPSVTPTAEPAPDNTPTAELKGSVSVPAAFEPVGEDTGSAVGELLSDKLGGLDEESGAAMSYGVVGSFEYEGHSLYCVSVRRLVQDENGKVMHSSRVGELVVDEELTAAYNAELTGDELLIYFDNDLLK